MHVPTGTLSSNSCFIWGLGYLCVLIRITIEPLRNLRQLTFCIFRAHFMKQENFNVTQLEPVSCIYITDEGSISSCQPFRFPVSESFWRKVTSQWLTNNILNIKNGSEFCAMEENMSVTLLYFMKITSNLVLPHTKTNLLVLLTWRLLDFMHVQIHCLHQLMFIITPTWS